MIPAGSEAERRRARELQRRLEEAGHDVDVEPTRVRPAFALTHAIHAGAGVIGSVVSVYKPGIGFLLVVIAAVSAFGDFTGAFALVRSLTPARASQNVVTSTDGDKPGLVVLVARYDSRRAGALLRGRLGAIWARALVFSLALITVCAAGRIFGFAGTALTILQFLPTVVLIVMTPLLIDVQIGAAGGDDNEAAIERALALAQDDADRLEHFDLAVVFTGASAHFGLGMRDWLRRHSKGLDTEATAFVVLEGEGRTFAEKEGPVVTTRMHSALVETAVDENDGYVSRDLSDAYRIRGAGLPAIRISPDGADDLLAQIDEKIGPRLAGG